MASEILPPDQKTDEPFEEKQVADGTKDSNNDAVSEPQKIEGKDEEMKLKVEDSENTKKDAVESAQKQKDYSYALVEEVKEEENHANASGSDVLAGKDVGEAENHKFEGETSTPFEPAVEVNEDLKRQGDESVTPEPPHEEIEKPKQDIKAPPLKEPEPEATKDSAVLGTVSEEGKSAEEGKEISATPSSTSETEDKPEEPLILFTAAIPASNDIETLGGDKSTETTQDEKNAIEIEATPEPLKEEVTEPPKFEDKVEKNVASESLDAGLTDAAELKASGEGVVALEASDAPEKTDAGSHAMRRVEGSMKEELGSGKFEELVKEGAVDAPPAHAAELKASGEGAVALEASDAPEKTDAGSHAMRRVEGSMKEEIGSGKFEELVKEGAVDAPAAHAAELKASGERAVALEASDAPEKTDAGSHAMRRVEGSMKEEIGRAKFEELVKEGAVDAPAGMAALAEALDASSVVEIPENPVKPEVKLDEEKEEKSIEAEVPIVSETNKMNAGGEVAEVLSLGEQASTGGEMVKEKDENLEDNKISQTSKDLDVAAARMPGVLSEEGRVPESAEIVEPKDENLEREKTDSKGFDATTVVAEPSLEGEKAPGVEMVGKLKDENLKDDITVLANTTPQGLDSAAEVAEVLSGTRQDFEGLKMEKEEKHELVEGGKPSIVEAFDNLDVTTGNAEMVEGKKGESLEGEEPLLDMTSKDSANVAEVSSVEERTFEHAELVKEKKDEEEKTSEDIETIKEEKDRSLKLEDMTSAGTSEVHDVEGKNVTDTSTKEPVRGALELDEKRENVKGKEESEKPDDENFGEPAKDGDTANPEGEVPKHEPPAKSSPRHSNNIISKVKQSIVKVKKAIIGKSPSSKSMTTGAN